ncbi:MULTISPECIES: pyridoxal phosphate-dependent aminotransferase [unclassified Dinoroseobacter]|uniref:pyridoxal phosphate-dependent aminotransferase n=1 Tax=unclassified Dinoroseobacter TaxID=2620028 RepID=UPI003C7DD902
MPRDFGLSDRLRGVEWSGIRKMHAMADGMDDVINLGIGQPDFDTPSHIIQAAKDALDAGYTRYPPARGFADLRAAIAEKLKRQNALNVDPAKHVMVTVGAMQVVFNTMLNHVEPGAEVIVMDPGYDYFSQIRLFGGTPVSVPLYEENGFRLNPDDLRAAITERTVMIVVNSPSNPTGAVFDRETLEAIAAIATDHDLLVFSDEPYEDLCFDDRAHVSIASLPGMFERTMTAFTLSKTYAMTGWRVGYVVGPERIVDEMEKLMEHLVSGVTAVSQRAALAAITGSQDCVADMMAAYARRRDIVDTGLNAIPRLSCVRPEATFYAFPNIKATGLSSWDLAEHLLQSQRVITIPGPIFGPAGEGYIRISFAVPDDQLKDAIDRIAAGIAALPA